MQVAKIKKIKKNKEILFLWVFSIKNKTKADRRRDLTCVGRQTNDPPLILTAV